MEAVDLACQSLTLYRDRLEMWTQESTQFIDLTEWVGRGVARSGVDHGIVIVRVLHTTAAIVINEHEPLLLEDFKAMLGRLAPEGDYHHDDPRRRRVNLEPGERRNGHSHARALLLGDAKQLAVVEGRLELGRWQSIFLVELDGPRKRLVSLSVIGQRRG